MSGDKLFEIMLPNANDPAMNAEKHSIARWPLDSEVMNSVYSAAKTLGLLGWLVQSPCFSSTTLFVRGSITPGSC